MDARSACCDELRSALEATLLSWADQPGTWLLYGTDHDSAIAGEPELRYWPVRFCPFCGARLPTPSARS